MKLKSIYPTNNSLQLKEVLSKYNPRELLYAPIDVAKYNHKGCAVNFFGDILTPAFDFPNNTHGVDFFISKITKAAKNSEAKKIFIGLESTGHYHQNLTLRLRSLGYDVAVINPFDSWKERLNKSAKTDKIDLGSIAKSLLSPENSLLPQYTRVSTTTSRELPAPEESLSTEEPLPRISSLDS